MNQLNEEIKLHEELKKGQLAKELLEHPLLSEVIENLEKDAIHRLKTAPVRDIEGQHELVLMLKVIDKFKSDLKHHIKTGELARFSLMDLAKKASNVFKMRS
jgi:hypothetical protein